MANRLNETILSVIGRENPTILLTKDKQPNNASLN